MKLGSVYVLLALLLCVTSAEPVVAGVNSWTTEGPFGASVSALAIDPVTPSTLYAGTYQGIYRSTDQGGHWPRVFTLFFLGYGHYVSALVVDLHPIIFLCRDLWQRGHEEYGRWQYLGFCFPLG